MTIAPSVTARLGDRHLPRAVALRWEARRAEAVLKKFASRLGPRAIADIAPGLDMTALRHADLDSKRAALLTIKTGLGHAGIYALLRKEMAFTERISRAAVAASRGRTTHSVARITAPGVSAQAFAAWFNNLTTADDEATLIDALPDHYLLRGLPDGRQEVVEVIGGSPGATRFLVDYDNADRLSVQADTSYDVQVAGHAVLDDGLIIGGVRHQFRDNDATLEALLTVEFPALTPPWMVSAHRWHLAVEFTNWIIAFDRASTSTPS